MQPPPLRDLLRRALRFDRLSADRFAPDVARLLRRERVAQAVANTPSMMVANGIFATVVTVWFLGRGVDGPLLAWLATCLILFGHAFWRVVRRDRSRPVSGTRRGERAIVAQTLIVATLFSIAPFILIPVAEGHDAAIIAGLSAATLVIGPYVVYSVPAAGLGWIATCTLFNTVSYVGSGDGPFVISGFFGLVIAVGVGRACITQSERLLARFELQQQAVSDRAAIAEKSEMISLLLKEYEDNSGAWLWECDAGGRLTRLPEGLREATGLDERETRVTLLELIGEEALDPLMRRRARDLMHTPCAFDDLVVSVPVPGGERRWLAVRGTPLYETRHGERLFAGYRGIANDVTETKEAEDRVRYLAAHDALTGLLNRVTFADGVRPWAKAGRPFASLHLDLDRFKLVNDTMGHMAGDELLRQVAVRLRRAVEEAHPQGVCARAGGDEFIAAIPLKGGSDAPVRALAGAIVDALGQPFTLDGGSVTIGASVGFALFPHDAPDLADMPGRADLALYRAKAEGRGRFARYEPGMDRRAQDRKRLETDLAGALSRDELHLAYQPLVNLADGRFTGVEALLRWNHPELGAIGPDVFIPIAEESGMIVELGAWVLRSACAEAAGWARPLSVAVNVSARQILRKDFTRVVLDTLEETGLAPDRLEVELTESILIEDAQTALDAIESLRDAGVRVVLDDFGTGYSSLSYLRDFAFDKIKIDRSFVSAMGAATMGAGMGTAPGGDRANPETLVTAIVNLAQTLGMATTAEGIEEDAQAVGLRAMGCDLGQGYLFSRPLRDIDLRALCGMDDTSGTGGMPVEAPSKVG